jgi:hypothetical protein
MKTKMPASKKMRAFLFVRLIAQKNGRRLDESSSSNGRNTGVLPGSILPNAGSGPEATGG